MTVLIVARKRVKMNTKKETYQKTQNKITDIYESSVYFVPRTLDDEMIDRLSKTAIKLVLKLNRYFSTETGRKLQRNTYKMSDLLKELGSNKPISSKCFFDIIKQIKENKLFLMYEDLNTKDKEFTFFLPNEFNESIFRDVELQKKYFKNKTFTHVLDNNITKLSSKKEKLSSENENSTSNNWNSSSSFENSSSENEKSSSKNEVPETIENTTQEPISKKPQDYYIKDNLYKDNYIQETSYSKNDTTEKVSTENKKDAVCDVSKNLNEKEKEKVIQEDLMSKVISEQEKILIDFGVVKEKVSNFDEICALPKEFILECIDTVNNKSDVKSPVGLLLSVIKKGSVKKEVAAALPSAPKKVSATHEVENKIIDFFFENKLLPIKESVTALDEAIGSLITFKDNFQVMTDFKELGISKSDLVQVFKGRAGFPPYLIGQIKELLAGY
jgi:hypothetical protein